MSILLKLKTVAVTRLGSLLRQDMIDDATTVETEVNRIAARLDPVIDEAGAITLGGIQRNTWPAASGAAAGLNDILANGADGNLAAGSSAFVLRNTDGSLVLLSLDKATGNLTILGTVSHAAATAAGHGVRADQVQNQVLTRFVTSGINTAYTLTPSPALTALAAGQRFRVQFSLTAGATPTLAISGLTAKPLKFYNAVGAKVACGAANIVADLLSDVEYDGTDYVVINPAGIEAATAATASSIKNQSMFSAWKNSNQTIVSGVPTRLSLTQETFDIGGVFDNATNYRFQPNVAGYYQLNFGAVFIASGTLTSAIAYLYKNGSTLYKRGSTYNGPAITQFGSYGSALVYANGSTDYFELYGYAVGTTPYVYGDAVFEDATVFCGVFVGP